MVLVLLVLLFGLREIDWYTHFNIEQNTQDTEEKLGDLLWEAYEESEIIIDDPYIEQTLDSIVRVICDKNQIDTAKIQLHLINSADINAFALPNGHLVINSGLILASESQEELTGVICHEIAHIELNHVMKKLMKEVGLSVLISMTTGGGSGEIIKETMKLLSSSAFDRSLEKEADLKAVDYLTQGQIDSEPFAHFLYRLADSSESLNYFSWISTHPDSKERSEYIIEYRKSLTIDTTEEGKAILSKATWEALRARL